MSVPIATTDALRRWFNENQDRPRIMALMSPTCGFCLIGHQAIRTYHSWLENEDFVTNRVWIPMMAGDTIEDAERQANTTTDGRISDAYDGQHEVGRLFRDVLGLAAAAWDTYMLYLPGTRWEAERPPMPDHYEYQLYPSYAPDQARLFTPSSFWWHVVESVGRSRDAYDAEVPMLAAWLNDDPQARVGMPVPPRYRGLEVAPHD